MPDTHSDKFQMIQWLLAIYCIRIRDIMCTYMSTIAIQNLNANHNY